MEIKKRLENRMHELGINQNELAKCMGISRQAVDQMKRRSFEQLRSSTRRNLCSSLDVGEDFFRRNAPTFSEGRVPMTPSKCDGCWHEAECSSDSPPPKCLAEEDTR